MSDNKKYYYLKLKDNFFDDDAIIVLESMPDGHLYSNILLKLYLRSLRNEGRLMFNDVIPYNSTMLSQITRHSVGVVEKALRVLNSLNLIEILDNGAIYMADIQNFIGRSSTEGDRKREYRTRIEKEKQLLELPEGQMSDICPPELEIEKEIEKEIETSKEKKKSSVGISDDNLQAIIDKWNSIGLNQVARVNSNSTLKSYINARFKENGLEEIFRIIDVVPTNKLLMGEATDWQCNFDWIMTKSNFEKVQRGNYPPNRKGGANGTNWTEPTAEELAEKQREYERKQQRLAEELDREYAKQSRLKEERERERQENQSHLWSY